MFILNPPHLPPHCFNNRAVLCETHLKDLNIIFLGASFFFSFFILWLLKLLRLTTSPANQTKYKLSPSQNNKKCTSLHHSLSLIRESVKSCLWEESIVVGARRLCFQYHILLIYTSYLTPLNPVVSYETYYTLESNTPQVNPKCPPYIR